MSTVLSLLYVVYRAAAVVLFAVSLFFLMRFLVARLNAWRAENGKRPFGRFLSFVLALAPVLYFCV